MPATYALSAELSGLRCPTCGFTTLAPAVACASCKTALFEWDRIALETHATVRRVPDQQPDEAAPTRGSSVPITVEMNDGPILTGRVLDVEPSRLRTGQPVRLIGFGGGCWLFIPSSPCGLPDAPRGSSLTHAR
ncbi:MAG: hypothetical protein IT307_12425 [Chloroflexi bacterium]|nr:hypothetical protein [Chloroflexota bacterium]